MEKCLFCNKELKVHIPKKGVYSNPDVKFYRCKDSKCLRYNRNADAGLTERFNRFWMSYPRKEGKKMCKQIWFKIQPEDNLTDNIIDVVGKYQENIWKHKATTFTPMPETFLRQERWENNIDEIVEEDNRRVEKELDSKKAHCYNTDITKKPKTKPEMTEKRRDHIKKVIADGRKALNKKRNA